MSQATHTQPLHLAAALEEAVSELLRTGPNTVGIALFDLDRFRERTGSQRRVSAVGRKYHNRLRRAIRTEGPTLAIYGYSPDGLAAIAVDKDAVALVLSADRVRLQLRVERGGIPSMTVSVGVAVARARKDLQPASLVWAAAGALADAKRAGRDRVVVAEPAPMVMKSSYYPRSQLDRLARLSESVDRPEASLLREALGMLLYRYEGE